MARPGARVEETEGAAALADAFWPGPLTLVLPLRDALPACPGGTLAIRVPDAPWVRRLSAACGHPLTGTSAIRAVAPPATTGDAVGAQFPSGIGLVVDGGSSPGGAPSTLLDLTGPSPRLLREGRIGRRVLQERLGLALSGPPAERP